MNKNQIRIPQGIALRCPRCDYVPKSSLFLKLPLSNYLMQFNRKKLMQISCRSYGCAFKGDLLDWISLYYEDG